MNWKARRLDQLGSVSRGRSRHRPRDAAHLYGGPYPFIQTGDVKHAPLYVTEHSQTYSEAGLAQSRLWPAGTLCITIAANIADTAILTYEACFPDSVIGFIADPEKANAKFIKYYFDARMKGSYRQFSQGAAQDNLSQEKLLSLDLVVPVDVREQERIADVLSAYDDLIENNRRRISLLEQSARLLYREWFVHLRFPGHEHVKVVDGVPDGWCVRPLGNCFLVRKGRNITRAEVAAGEVPVVAGGLEPSCHHNVANAKGPVVTISASGANAGFVRLYASDIWASDCSYISGDTTAHIYYVYCLLKQQQSRLTAMQKGAAQPHVYPKDVQGLEVPMAPDGLIAEFEQLVSPTFELMAKLEAQSALLAKGRDLVLPRLMNGDLMV